MRTLSEISREICRDWQPVNYAARPYLVAMMDLQTINDRFINDSARSVVTYFLGNAKGWRGDVAKRVKAELNAMLKSGG
jgi:hypothetical protein